MSIPWHTFHCCMKRLHCFISVTSDYSLLFKCYIQHKVNWFSLFAFVLSEMEVRSDYADLSIPDNITVGQLLLDRCRLHGEAVALVSGCPWFHRTYRVHLRVPLSVPEARRHGLIYIRNAATRPYAVHSTNYAYGCVLFCFWSMLPIPYRVT